ncbi:MAG: hypothetical protein ABI700_00765 [Chloroflexota bacterium]
MDIQAEPTTTETRVNLEDVTEADLKAAGTPQTMADCTPDERLLIWAVRHGDQDEIARLMVKKMFQNGQSAAEILKTVIEIGDEATTRAYIKAVNAQINPVPTVWTYERRLAFYVLGAQAVGYPGLPDELLNSDSTNTLESAIDTIADALIAGMHTLGCPADLSLAKILDYASSYGDEEADGAE